MENFFGVSRPTQDGHADNILSEVYGAISILDMVTERAIRILGTVNAHIIMMGGVFLSNTRFHQYT